MYPHAQFMGLKWRALKLYNFQPGHVLTRYDSIGLHFFNSLFSRAHQELFVFRCGLRRRLQSLDLHLINSKISLVAPVDNIYVAKN